MATQAITIAIANPYPTPVSTASPTGGGWGGNTYSFLLVANYNKTGYDHDGMGWSTASRVHNIAVAANDKVTFVFNASDPIPTSYSFYYRVGTSITLGTDVLTHIGDCAGSLLTVTFDSPDDAHTTTFAAAQTSFDLDPCTLIPTERPNVSRSYDGQLGQLSYRTERMHNALVVKLRQSETPLTLANWRVLRKAARGNIRVLITDGDTEADVLTWTCMVNPGSGLYSQFKADGDISLSFIVESETYHA